MKIAIRALALSSTVLILASVGFAQVAPAPLDLHEAQGVEAGAGGSTCNMIAACAEGSVFSEETCSCNCIHEVRCASNQVPIGCGCSTICAPGLVAVLINGASGMFGCELSPTHALPVVPSDRNDGASGCQMPACAAGSTITYDAEGCPHCSGGGEPSAGNGGSPQEPNFEPVPSEPRPQVTCDSVLCIATSVCHMVGNPPVPVCVPVDPSVPEIIRPVKTKPGKANGKAKGKDKKKAAKKRQ